VRVALDAAKIGCVVFLAAIVQVTIVAPTQVAGGTADVLLVTLVVVALLRGAVIGASAGFVGGLVADFAAFETLGVTSLLLTLAGYWIGRYGETTGRDRAHAPLLSVVVITVLYAVGSLVLHFVLGVGVSARYALLTALPPAIVLNALLAVPLYALSRRLLPPAGRAERTREVQLLG
jgi:rod shape-determining protein MreD